MSNKTLLIYLKNFSSLKIIIREQKENLITIYYTCINKIECFIMYILCLLRYFWDLPGCRKIDSRLIEKRNFKC